MQSQSRQTALIVFLIAAFLAGCAKKPISDAETSKDNDRSRSSGATDKVTRIPRDDDGPGNSAGTVPHSLNSSFVVDDVFGAIIVHPRQMLSSPILAEFNLARLIDAAMPEVGMSVADVEQVVWLLSVPERLKPAPVLPHASSPSRLDSQQDAAAIEKVDPPVHLDDLFEGLKPAGQVPEEEDAAWDPDPTAPPEVTAVLQDSSGFHAFDVLWTPRFLPMILRFAESSKASRFSQRLTMEMSEVEFDERRYYTQPSVSGRPPTIGPDDSPAIRQYLDLGPMSVYLPDAHTVVLATEDHIQRILATAQRRGSPSDTGMSPLREMLDAARPDIGATAVIDFQRLRRSGNEEPLIEDLSDRFLASRMALFNLADDAELAVVRFDVASETLIQLEFTSRTQPLRQESLLKSVGNFVVLLSESYEQWKTSLADPPAPQLKSLVELVDELVPGTTVKISDAAIIVRTPRPAKFSELPRVVEALLEQVVREAEEALWRHSLEQIALAMQVYVAEHDRLPPAATYDEQGKPLLSWRVHLLPYLGHEELHAEFKLDEAWNSSHNITLLGRMPSIYGRESAETHVMVFTGPATLFEAEKSTDAAVITSSRSASTILLVRTEGDRVAVWTEPKDLDVSEQTVIEALGNESLKGFLAAFCNGTVREVTWAEPLEEMIRCDSN